jgi:hypothetical protein
LEAAASALGVCPPANQTCQDAVWQISFDSVACLNDLRDKHELEVTLGTAMFEHGASALIL